MSITVNDNLQNNSPRSLDNKYTKLSGAASAPYSSTAEANSTIPLAYRSIGQTVLIDSGSGNVEYWYKDGIDDINLIVKDLGYFTAENGLTKTGSVVKLGGSLTGNTVITTSTFQLTVSSNTSTAPVAIVNSSTGSGLTVGTASGTGITSSSTSGNGASLFSGSAIGVVAGSNGNFGADVYRSTTLTSSMQTALRVRSVCSNTPIVGFGTKIDFHGTTDGGSANFGSIGFKWTNASNSNRSAQMVIDIADIGSVVEVLYISSTGVFTLVQGLTDYTDDAAAATGGIPVGGLYRTGSTVKIRVS